MNTPALQLLTRPGCHLCDDLEGQLTSLGLPYKLVDIDADPSLQQRYTYAIPVLLHGDTELARAPIDPSDLEAALAGAGLIQESRQPG
jgi:hypothetical protein